MTHNWHTDTRDRSPFVGDWYLGWIYWEKNSMQKQTMASTCTQTMLTWDAAAFVLPFFLFRSIVCCLFLRTSRTLDMICKSAMRLISSFSHINLPIYRKNFRTVFFIFYSKWQLHAFVFQQYVSRSKYFLRACLNILMRMKRIIIFVSTENR